MEQNVICLFFNEKQFLLIFSESQTNDANNDKFWIKMNKVLNCFQPKFFSEAVGMTSICHALKASFNTIKSAFLYLIFCV
jgi:hypothetical protein